MKWNAVIVLVAIVLGVFISPTMPLMVAHGGQASIGVLDVCHGAVPALSSSGEMPCVNELACLLLSLGPSRANGMVNPLCKPFFIAFPDERPPKA